MELFIRIKDGQPFEHPIFGCNFRAAFPDVDVDNLPPEFARFERIDCPNSASTFEVNAVSYQWVDGVVKDIWSVRQMTPEEKDQKLKRLSDEILAYVPGLKDIARQRIDAATTLESRQAWLDYLEALNAWTLIDPIQPNLPSMPTVAQDGVDWPAEPGSVQGVDQSDQINAWKAEALQAFAEAGGYATFDDVMASTVPGHAALAEAKLQSVNAQDLIDAVKAGTHAPFNSWDEVQGEMTYFDWLDLPIYQ